MANPMKNKAKMLSQKIDKKLGDRIHGTALS